MDNRTRPLCAAAVLVALLIGCHGGAHTKEPKEKLGPREALHHAVDLANEECQEELGAAPFDSTSYEARFDGERWRWGDFGVHGVKGYSAVVSFDQYGEHDSVAVRLNVDVHDSEQMDSLMKK
ncbi:MAG: hypothetical protein GF331_06245 [Chitinivibrionales bacterium]|nr:hypothetical protein [Chitinivibrionales bacterium]